MMLLGNMILVIIYFQVKPIPAVAPQLLEVNMQCQEFVRLSHDLPKYYSGSTLFTSVHKTEWEQLTDTNSEYYHFTGDTPWTLHDLMNKKHNQVPFDMVFERDGILKQLELRVSKKDRALLPEVPVFLFHLLYIYYDFT